MSERPSVHHLATTPEQPTPRKYFDPDKDVTPKMWRRISTSREYAAREEQWRDFPVIASCELLAGREVQISEPEWGELGQRARRPEPDPYEAARYGILQLISGHQINLDGLDWGDLEHTRNQAVQRRLLSVYAIATSFELLAGRPVAISNKRWQEIADDRKTSQDPEYFAALALLEMLRDARIERDSEGKITRIVRPTEPADFQDDTPPLPKARNF